MSGREELTPCLLQAGEAALGVGPVLPGPAGVLLQPGRQAQAGAGPLVLPPGARLREQLRLVQLLEVLRPRTQRRDE